MLELRVCIDVDDLDRAIAFYTTAFGLTVGRRQGRDFAELLGGRAPIDLLARPAGSRPFAGAADAEARRYDRHWTPVHLDVVVDDLDAALARAEAAGATRSGEVRRAAWGRLALLADPFGHGLCLLEFHGRGYDEVVAPA